MTYKRTIKHITILSTLLLVIQGSLFGQGYPSLDCSTALRLCNTNNRNDTIQAPFTGVGFDDLAGGDSVCWASGENRPFWYKFTVANTGPFEMTIDDNVFFGGAPLALSFANNWAIYDVTGGCNIGPSTQVACLDNGGNTGPTGIRNIPPNARFIAPINLTAGRTYALVIDLGTGFIAGFDIFIELSFNDSGLPGAVDFSSLNANFTVSDDTACVAQVLNFTDITSGGDPPYLYNWDFGDGSGTSTLANPNYAYTANGSYNVSLTVDNDTNLTCTSVVNQTIVVQDVVVTVDPVPDQCPNSPPVSLTGNPAGGTFSGPGVVGNTFDPSIVGTGTYIINYNYTDPNGCTNSDNISINVLTPVVLTVDKASETICESIDTAVFTAAGASSYQWFEVGNPAVLSTSNVFSISPIVTTQYTVRGENAAGCADFDTVTVFVNPPPTVNISASSNPICFGNSATLTASGADTYQWFEVGNAVAISTSAAINVSPAASTDYLVIGTTTATGCFDSTIITLTVNPLPTVGASADINPICPGGTSTLTGSGADTYQWFEVGNAVAISTSPSVAVSPAVSTDYIVIGTNTTTSCFDTAFITVNVNAAVTVNITAGSNPICQGESTNLTASGADTYEWFEVGNATAIGTSSVISVSPLVNTDYIAVGTATISGCIDSAFITLTVNPSPPVAITASSNPICNGESTSLTASGADTYQWFEVGNAVSFSSSSVVNVSPATNTDYLVVGTETVTGCFDTAFITISVNPLPTVNSSADLNPICVGQTSNLTGSGADTYQWFEVGNATAISTSANVAVSPVVSTDYFVVGNLTATGCFDTSFITINVNANPLVNITADSNPICLGDTTNLNAAGADTYQWFEVGNAISIGTGTVISVSPAATTDYLLVGTATATGCIDSATITLNVNPLPNVNAIASSNPICLGESSTLTASGADTYLWFEVGNAISFSSSAIVNVSPAVSTNYFVIGNETATGCSDSAFISITVNPGPNVNATADVNPICPGDSSNLTASGADTYQWFEVGNAVAISTSATVAVSPAVDTDYFVIGTNTLTSCFDTAFITVSVNPAVNVNIIAAANPICQGETTTLTASGADTYQWFEVGNATSIGSGANINVSPVASTDYITVGTITATGCIDSAFFTLNVDPLPTVNSNASANPICFGESTTLTAGGTDTYQWFEVGNAMAISTTANVSVSPASNTDYFVIGTQTSTGCFDTSFISIIVNALPNVTASADANPICIGSSSNLSASGADTYLWFEVGNAISIGNTATINVSPAASTDYIVVGTDTPSGCFDSAFISISVVPGINPTVSIAFNPDTTCLGDTTFFTTTVTGSGISPTFQWFVNNINQGGFTSSTFFSNSLNPGDQVKVLMTSSEPCATGIAGDSLTPLILNNLTTSVSLSQSPSPVCFGDTTVFIASPTNGGSSPVYSWTINGSPQVGITGDSLISNSVNNGDLVSVQMSSSEKCNTGPAAANINANINPTVNPTVSLIQSPSPSCVGDTASFTASFSGGGTTPVFAWTVNGSPQAGFTGSTFFSTTLSNGDLVEVSLTSSEVCSSGPVSANLAASITSNVNPTVSIVQTPNPVCSGDTVIFSTVSSGEGSSPTFQWSINTIVQVGETGPSLTSTTINDNDLIEVLLTSSASCATGTANSNLNASVVTTVSPNVSLVQNPSSACSGSNIDIIASQSGGGLSPAFSWTVNGIAQAATGNVLSSSSFNNGDTVDVLMTSSSSCAIPSTANSSLIVSLTGNITPSVSLSQLPSSFCNGDSVRFNATPTSGGLTPSYNWFVNGVLQGTNLDFIEGNTFINGDQVVVELISSEICATATAFDTLSANSVASVVTQLDSIVYDTNPVCSGTALGFKAYVSGQGISPLFTWEVNGIDQSVNSDSISLSTLANGDSIRFTVASSSSCASPGVDDSVFVINSVFDLQPIISVIQPSACGSGNGIITVDSVNQGSGSYQYLINSIDSSTNTFSGLGSGAYLITINDLISSCSFDTTININVAGAISASVSTTPTLCSGLNNGQAQFLSLSGGSGFYEFSIDTGATWQNSNVFNSLAPGNYLGIVRDSLDPTCTFQLNFFIGSSFNVSAIIQIDKETSCGANDAQINILSVSGGTSPYQFILLDSIGDTLEPVQPITSSVDSLSPGNYSLIILDANGCELTINVTINGLIAPSATPIEVQAVSCFGGNDGALALSNSQGGSGAYLYSIDGGTFQPDTLFNNLLAGNHILSIQDVNTLCTSNYNFVQSQPDSMQLFTTITPPTNCSSNNGIINIDSVLGGNGSPYTFELNGNTVSSPITGLDDGFYTLIVSDNSSCTDTNAINITVSGSGTPNVSIQNIDCFGDTSGVLIVDTVIGGTAPFQFSLDNVIFDTTRTFTGLGSGNGVLFMEDASGCLTTLPYFISENPEITANVTTADISDCNLTDGSISISNISGGQPNYVVQINGNSQANIPPAITVFNNLDNGVYTIQILDQLNCIAEFTDTIFAPNNIVIGNIITTNPICYGANSGSVELTGISGGVTPYSFALNGNAVPSNPIGGLFADSTYTITVIDNDNCDVSVDVSLTQPDSLSFDLNITGNADCGENTGSVLVLNPIGGDGNYVYEIIGITGQQSSTLFDSLGAGNYNLLMSDGNNCQQVRSFQITGTALLNYSVSANSITCNGSDDAAISISGLQNGFAPFAISFDNGNQFLSETFRSDTTFNQISEGLYDIVIRDSLNCFYNFASTIEITEPDAIVAEIENITMSIEDSATGRVAIYDVLGGTEPYTLSFDGDSAFNLTLNPNTQAFDTVLEKIAEGLHTIRINDSRNCTEFFEVYVEVYEFANSFTIPNIFTPNQDGYNDYFVIPKLPSGSKLKIFEKSGRPVFSSDDYQNDWDGEGYADGTYFYTLEIPNQGMFKGFIEIFR